MIQKIRTSRFSKIIASYLAIQMIVTVVQPSSLYALTSGPSQPEFNAFTPIGTSDMVNLSSGDFNYNIPIMDVGGYPLNLAYDSGVTMDQEASWVGLGWNLNVGQINRQVRGIPDDFNGDEMIYEDSMKDNKTVGIALNFNPSIIGLGDVGLGVNAGISIQHNNYDGLSFQPSYGLSFNITESLSVGASLSSSASDGASVSPYVSLSQKLKSNDDSKNVGLGGNLGLGYNSRQGLSSFNIGVSSTIKETDKRFLSGGTQSGNGSISFVNNSFTPVKRVSYTNSSATFSASYGFDIWGLDLEKGITGFGNYQSIEDEDKTRNVFAYGYNFTHMANPENSVLDFNREKEGIISKNTTVLPPTNYTYDIYKIDGQGTGGMFRPFRGQVGNVYSNNVSDKISNDRFGGEATGGTGWHVGFDFRTTDGVSRTGKWNDPVSQYFSEQNNVNNAIDYERVYYKTIGEYTVDPESQIYNDRLGGSQPIRIGIGGGSQAPGKTAQNKFYKKDGYVGDQGSSDYSPIAISDQIKRTQRELRNKAIISVTHAESKFDPLISWRKNDAFVRDHHIAGYKTVDPDGSRYIYGETVYNTKKTENTFNVKSSPVGNDDIKDGLVNFNEELEDSKNNQQGVDHYFNKIETPHYAHTYLLTAVLSSDYEDLGQDGPTDDDLGAYTKFNYTLEDDDFKWGIPYQKNKASYNPGLNSINYDSSVYEDHKGSYVRGAKELKYIETIETKTHVAFFKLLGRQDAEETADGNGDHMHHIDKIYLFTKPEYQALLAQYSSANNDPNDVPLDKLQETAIKVAHFEYNYSLCPGIPNGNAGKLTLEKLYFTYRDSFMGKYTPYTFYYGVDINNDGDPDNNYAYGVKAYDIWGNYKPNESTSYDVFGNPLSPQEFPFVQQDDKALQDLYASAWSLTKIDLPSGGTIDVSYETDDYAYVQDRKAMRMFKVVGVTKDQETPIADHIINENTGELYKNGTYDEDARYLIVELPETQNLSGSEFTQKYLQDQLDQPIYFRFMLNMTKDGGLSTLPSNDNNHFDYVTGYFRIADIAIPNTFADANGRIYGAIPMEFTNMEGGVNGGQPVNPISKAGWYFARRNLQKLAYGLPQYTDASIKDIMEQLLSDIGALDEMFIGPNAKLRNQRLIARRFVPERSWIRLTEPNNRKLGGGVRVQKIEMHDEWDAMVSSSNPNYAQFYGQEYNYNLEDGTSAGVATYEPNMSKENPFVEPFFQDDDHLVAPRELNYVEKPFGESFFPSPTVTYSRVEVKNLTREKDNGATTLTKHATGKVVNEFYTSKDFPTIVDYTNLDGPNNLYSNEDELIGQTLGTLLNLNINVSNELTLSQGFSIQTNDMNGRQKKQSVYGETGSFISGVENIYHTDAQGQLSNTVPTVDKNGAIANKEVGLHYEVITDFNESYTRSKTFGIQANTNGIPLIPFPIIIPVGVPEVAEHTNVLHTVTATKLINRTAILKERIAKDLGATVTTRNLAWDAGTGEILLTETDNEYNDTYFNFSYPAYWYYEGMGQAVQNIGIEGKLQKLEQDYRYTISNAGDIFFPGDEILATHLDENGDVIADSEEKLWVVTANGNEVQFMDQEGSVVAYACEADDIQFKIVRSGFRNTQTASMASVTSMLNPLDLDNNDILDDDITNTTFHFPEGSTGADPKVVNASGVEYSEAWKLQGEMNIPGFPNNLVSDFEGMYYGSDTQQQITIDPRAYGFNPYLYNARGDWRAKRSFAYLAGRKGVGVNASGTNPSPRSDGYFTHFEPFLTRDGNTTTPWKIDTGNWTFASQVSEYSAFGAELENKDALNRFSSAQYGYNYTLPVAVASNASYNEMGFDGFEDYGYQGTNNPGDNSHFGWYTGASGSVSLEDQVAHTGRSSIKVTGETSLVRDYTNQCNNDVAYEDPSCACACDGDWPNCLPCPCPERSSPDQQYPVSDPPTYERTFEQLFNLNGIDPDLIEIVEIIPDPSSCIQVVSIDNVDNKVIFSDNCPDNQASTLTARIYPFENCGYIIDDTIIYHEVIIHFVCRIC